MSRYYRSLIQTASAPAYTYLSDLTSETSVSMRSINRLLKNGYSGSLIRVRRASDNVESDFGAGSNGLIDSAAVDAFIGASTGYIVYIYDQSGSGYHMYQATAADQFELTPITINSESLYYGNAIATEYMKLDAGSAVFSLNNFHEMVVAQKKTTAFTILSGKARGSTTFSSIDREMVPTSSNVRMRINNTFTTANYPGSNYDQRLLYEMSRAGSTSVTNGYVHNTSTTNSTTVANQGSLTDVQYGRLFTANGGASFNFVGYFFEQVDFTDEMSSADQTAVRGNITTFYNF